MREEKPTQARRMENTRTLRICWGCTLVHLPPCSDSRKLGLPLAFLRRLDHHDWCLEGKAWGLDGEHLHIDINHGVISASPIPAGAKSTVAGVSLKAPVSRGVGRAVLGGSEVAPPVCSCRARSASVGGRRGQERCGHERASTTAQDWLRLWL